MAKMRKILNNTLKRQYFKKIQIIQWKIEKIFDNLKTE